MLPRPVDFGNDDHVTFVTYRAAMDVDSREPKKLLGDGFLRARFRLWGREQRTTESDLLPTRSIREQAVVTDPHEALRQNVEQEATDELVDVEVQDLLLATVRVIPISESDMTVFKAQDTVIGDRDAMGVSAEVGEYALRPREGRLGIDDPVEVSKLVAERENGSVLTEFVAQEGMAESVDELRSEDLGECTHGEEEALVAQRDEALAIGGERASRNDAVEMRMQREILPPGVKDGGDAELPAGVGGEELGIAGKGGERVGGSAKEKIVDHTGSVDREGAEFVGQGEDDVEVVDGEKVGAPCLDPVCLRECLTLRAVSIAAGVIDGAPVSATVTRFEMTPESLGTALAERSDSLALDGAHGMRAGITLAMTA